MAEQSTLETMLRLQVDPADAARALKAIDKTRDALKDLQRAQVAQDNAAKASTRTIKEQTSALDAAAKQARAAQDAAGRIQSATGGLRGIAQSAGASGVSEALNVGSDIAGLAEELPKLKESLKALPEAAGAAANALGAGGLGLGAGILAVTAVLAIFQQRLEAARNELQLQLQAQDDYNAIIARDTQATIDKRLEANRIEVETAELDLKTRIKARDDAFEALNNAPILRDNSDLVAAYQAAGEAVNAQLEVTNKAKQEEINLRNARNDAGVIARSLQLAEAELARQRQLLTDQLADVQLSTQLKVNSLTTEGANKRLQDIRDEINARQALINTGTLSVEKTKEYETAITKLGQEMVTLNIEILPLIQAREREAAAIAYQKKQIEETAEAVKKYNEDVASIEQKNLEARQAASERYYDRTVAIAEAAAQAAESALRQLEQRRSDLTRDLARAGIDAETQRQRDELDAQIDFQREEAKAARDHATELKRIRREANRDESQAIQDRDAVALDAAQTRKKDEIADATEGYQQAARERQIAFAQEASDRRVAFNRDRQDRLLKYQRDLADAQAAYAQDLQLAANKRAQDLAQARQAYQQDIATLQQKHIQELALRRNAAVTELRLIQQTESQRVAIMMQAQQQLINQARSLLATSGASAASAVPLGANRSNRPYLSPPSLDSGGRITRTGMALVHKGESVINPARGQSGAQMNIYINGAQDQTIEVKSTEQAVKVVERALRKMVR